MTTKGPVRLAIGLAALAMERVGVRGDALPTAVGLLQDGLRVARRAADPPARAFRWATRLPVVGSSLRRAGERAGTVVTGARDRGRLTVAASRADALAFVKTGVDDGFAWLVPQLRARVLPVVIEDLTNDPRLRDLVVEQSRGVLGEAAVSLRTHTETADDRVESAFRRLFRT